MKGRLGPSALLLMIWTIWGLCVDHSVLSLPEREISAPNRDILSISKDAWVTAKDGISKGGALVKDGVSGSIDTLNRGISKVSTVWIIGVTCAVPNLISMHQADDLFESISDSSVFPCYLRCEPPKVQPPAE